MKQFSLAGLLRVRDLEKQRTEGELAAANHALTGIRAHRAQTLADLAGTTVEISGAANLAAAAASRASAQTLLAELAMMHHSADQDAQEATTAHNAARANSLAIEKLQVRHLEAEHASDLRVEQSALDEIAIGGWRRGRGDSQ
ncbi:MAG: flagellar protein FliJ [Microbacteriaceae bacterium]|nr:flagellar protein FliJ [Microbacteriaceae bacterium]